MLADHEWIDGQVFTAAVKRYVAEKAIPGGAPSRGFMPGWDHFLECARFVRQQQRREAAVVRATPADDDRMQRARLLLVSRNLLRKQLTDGK
jgi:hypothetical protein